MGVIIIAFEGDCHTQCSPVIMKCLFKGAPGLKGRVLWLHSHGHTACHVERAPLPTAATPQLSLWVWTGRTILILHPPGAGGAHSCSQPFSWISNTHLLGFGCWLVLFLIPHDSFPAQLIQLSWPQIMCQIMKQSKYLPLSSTSI